MNKNIREINIFIVLKLLWKKIWLLLLGSLFGAIIALSIAWFIISPTYQSSTSFYVNNNSNQNTGNQYYSQTELNAAQSLVDTYIVILEKYPTLEAVIQDCGLSYTDEKLKSMISAKAENNTEIFTVTVTSTDPYEAQKIANSIADILPQQIANVVEGASVQVVARGKLNINQVAPSYKKYMLVGALLGLFIAIVIVLVRYYSDKKIHDESFINALQGDTPLLAVIPNLIEEKGKKKGYGYGYGYGYSKASSKNNSKAAVKGEARFLCGNVSFAGLEAYKLLRTNILYALTDKEEGCAVIGITSSMRGETKSTTSINLAYTFSETGKRVLLIEGDMRLPVIANRLNINTRPGLANILGGFCGIKEGLQPSKIRNNWYVISAGDIPPNPAELLESNQMKKIIEICKKSFDYIIIDLPPVNVVSDALAVSPSLNGMVMIAREEYTDMPALLDAVQKIEFSQVNLLGFVLTDSSQAKKVKYRGEGLKKKN